MDMYKGESVHSTRRGKMIESSIVHQATIEEVQVASQRCHNQDQADCREVFDISRPTRRQ